MKTTFKVSLFLFNYKTVFSSACCSILEHKNVKKLSKNFQYSKSQKAKHFESVLRPDLSFLQEKV